MVILIGAESCTGKTLMAQKLLERYHFPYLSIDHLKMGLYRADINCGFTPESDNDLIEGKLWPILKGIISTNIENNQNIIIEGCYLHPSRIKEFDKEYSNHIIPVFMGFSAEYIKKNYYSGIIAHRSDIEFRGYEDDRTIEKIIVENKVLKIKCAKHSVPFFEINDAYETDIGKIYQWIDNEVNAVRTRSESSLF